MPLPPLSFLLDASPVSLQDLELAALNRSSNLGKAVKSELAQWIEQEAAAMLARWMLDNREELLKAGESVEAARPSDLFEERRKRKSA